MDSNVSQRIVCPKNISVEEGNTLTSIATELHIAVDKLLSNNPNLTCKSASKDADGFCTDDAGKRRTSGGDLIYPGDKITIPSIFSYETMMVLKDWLQNHPAQSSTEEGFIPAYGDHVRF